MDNFDSGGSGVFEWLELVQFNVFINDGREQWGRQIYWWRQGIQDD